MLKNIDTENIDTNKLLKNYQKINSELLTRITLAKNEDKIAKLQSKLTAELTKQAEARGQITTEAPSARTGIQISPTATPAAALLPPFIPRSLFF